MSETPAAPHSPPGPDYNPKPAGADTGSQQVLSSLRSTEDRLNTRIRRVGWEFIVSQLLMVLVAVSSVYIAAREGLVQAVKFEQYQASSRLLAALETLQAELEMNQPVIEENLRLVRRLALSQLTQIAEARRTSVGSLEVEIDRLRVQLEQAVDGRERERAQHSLDVKVAAHTRMVGEVERLDMELQGFRQKLGPADPDIVLSDGSPLEEVELKPMRSTMWRNLASQPFLYELDARLVTDAARFYELADSLSQRMSGQSNWDDLLPMRIKGSTWDARRREQTLVEMEDLLEGSILGRIETAVMPHRNVVNNFEKDTR